MTNDGAFVYVWDEADRLKEVRKGADVVMRCRYDGLGRRRERVMNGETNRYVYLDGGGGGTSWLVLAVLDGSTNVLETYTHGPDLSGTLGGAGGIGGIVSVTHPGSSNATYFYHPDGNGNVVACTDTNGAVAARLDYCPFGTILTHSGTYIPRHQFSSKEHDALPNLYYYGYRFYSPQLGRWRNRDPIGERGGDNLYSFTKNRPIDIVDKLGLHTCPGTKTSTCFGFPITLSKTSDTTTVIGRCCLGLLREKEHKCSYSGSVTWRELVDNHGYVPSPGVNLDDVACEKTEWDSHTYCSL